MALRLRRRFNCGGTTGGAVRTIIFTSLLLMFFNAQANAQNCPEFFRFVDFGLEAPDGTIHRGGPTYRAEGFDGQALLIRDLTVCREVRNLAIDGRGNPIPVVTSINYSPEKTGIDLKELRLTIVEDVAAETERTASGHRARLERSNVVATRGPDRLCASLEGSDAFSCQLVSPFGGNLALVVYCTPLECRMPALVVKANIVAQASWVPSEAAIKSPELWAMEIADRVQEIHDFLAPLSS
jgi:hypothetical protein